MAKVLKKAKAAAKKETAKKCEACNGTGLKSHTELCSNCNGNGVK